MEIHVSTSLGELVDKITILNIKAQAIQQPEKLANVNHERTVLTQQLTALPLDHAALQSYMKRLQTINQRLWIIEDDIRDCEAQNDFSDRFIQLARAVYITNDERAAVKKEINIAFGSRLVEEKSYQSYQQTATA